MTGESMKRMPSLDGLRALAIMLVLVSHLGGARNFLSVKTLAWAGDLGNLGVRLFFVISGFLITRLLLIEIDRSRRISLKAFYIRRVLRIFPAFYVFIVFAMVLAGIGFATLDRRDVIHAVTYTMNYHANYSENFSLRHLWSLAVEEQFYMLWPLTVAILMPSRATRVLVAVVLVVPVLRVVLYTVTPGYENIADTGFESVCDALATGCLLAMAMPRLARMARFNRLVLSPLFPVLFAAIFIANKQRDHPKFFWLLCVPFMNVALALTVLRYVQAPFLPLGRLLNRQPLVSVGVLSYSLYLWQQLFLIQSRPVTSVFVVFPLNILMALACAAASYHLIEKPFLRLKHRFEPGAARIAPPSTVERETVSVLPRPGVPLPS